MSVSAPESTPSPARSTSLLGTGLLVALASSLCCITPLLAVIGGVGGAASTFSWVAPFRPYLIAATVAVLGFAWYQKLKPRPVRIDCCGEVEKPALMQSKRFLGGVTVLAAVLLAFPYFSSVFYPATAAPVVARGVAAGPVQVVEFKIAGMTCEACTDHVRHEVVKLAGIERLDVSYPQGNAVIAFHPAQTTIPQLTAAVNATGYRVTQTLSHDSDPARARH